jgi:cyclic beta-1,2-glucan synthetase
VMLELPPGESRELCFILGQAESSAAAEALVAKYRSSGAAERALVLAKQAWDELLGAVKIKTPDPALDMLHNHWLLYQSVSSRLWGRTGFYQSSGAYGFRDQLQDVMASMHARPQIAREHLLRAAAHQYAEGDVQHWWHDETGEGLRTRCSDDMLWLPYVVVEYVSLTGERRVLDEPVPFLKERVLAASEEDLFSAPPVTEPGASLYEHCVRALDAGMSMGSHGLPLMQHGDWNDGMNKVGHAGRGESVWLAWFLAKTLADFAPIAEQRGDRERAAWCRQHVTRLAEVVETHAWDGEWYRRAYFDDGTPLGSKESAECSIDAIAQSWAVISGIGDVKRAAAAVQASEARLIKPNDKLMQLLTPAFEHTLPDPGYIQAYPPGVRENGGQYTHGVLWTLLALTLQREGDRAGALLSLLNPIGHGDSADATQRYRVEPYVVAADVYSSTEHAGRGGWTWYTGSAGWMYRIVLENVLGLKRRGNALSINPCIPKSWGSFEVEYRNGSSIYRIVVDNPQHVCQGVARLEVNGKLVPDGQVRLTSDGHTYEVNVTLGHPVQARVEQARLGT